MREMVRVVINMRQCDQGTREGLSEVGIIEVRGGARGFSQYEGDGLNGGDEMGDELMVGRPSGSGVSDYLCCCDGKHGRVKHTGLPETVK
jgi:hypothetical protein